MREGEPRPEEVAKITEERTLHEADLIQGRVEDLWGELALIGGGAKFKAVETEDGGKQIVLEATQEQVEDALKDMWHEKGRTPEEAQRYVRQKIEAIGIAEGDMIDVWVKQDGTRNIQMKFLELTNTHIVGTEHRDRWSFRNEPDGSQTLGIRGEKAPEGFTEVPEVNQRVEIPMESIASIDPKKK